MARKLVAELVGTVCLVFFGAGSAVFGFDVLGPVGVGLAFGLVLVALAYAIGRCPVATSTRQSSSAC